MTARAADMTARGRRLAACLACLVILAAVPAGCGRSPDRPAGVRAAGKDARARKKVLLVNSYHPGYSWSDGITRAVLRSFSARLDARGRVDDSRSPVAIRLVYLDTKRHKSEKFKKKAAARARDLIESWKPDVLIAADDNASRYLVVPYCRGGDLPVVFCGVNQEAGKYGLPAANVTGMVEVFLLPQALAAIRPYARGDRVCALASDTLSEHKNVEHSRGKYGVDFHRVFYAGDMAGLEADYLAVQRECDLAVLFELASVRGFDRHRFLRLVGERTRVPSAAMYAFNRDFVLVTIANDPAEQGEWAAAAARAILAGASPSSIPIATNHRARIYLNMRLARKLGVVFPMDLIEQAEFTETPP